MNSILVIGTVAFDSVKTPAGEAQEVLGGSASFFSMAARLFAPVRLVAIVGKDFPEQHLQMFEHAGIDLEGLVRAEGRTFRWTGEYEENMNVRHTIETQLNVLADFKADVPASYRSSPYVFLANINPDLQLRVLDQLQSPKLVCCDTMNIWIVNQRKDLDEVLRRVDFLIISEEEAQMLSKDHNVLRGARQILQMGRFSLVVKRGAYGAILLNQQGEIFAMPAFPLEEVVDPTGAGDTFAGGFVGCLASAANVEMETVQKAMMYGNICASFSVEGFSIDRLHDLTSEKVRQRLQSFVRMTHLSSMVRHVE
jgi:sugar/nucleoside kinase (ribokinase family)